MNHLTTPVLGGRELPLHTDSSVALAQSLKENRRKSSSAITACKDKDRIKKLEAEVASLKEKEMRQSAELLHRDQELQFLQRQRDHEVQYLQSQLLEYDEQNRSLESRLAQAEKAAEQGKPAWQSKPSAVQWPACAQDLFLSMLEPAGPACDGMRRCGTPSMPNLLPQCGSGVGSEGGGHQPHARERSQTPVGMGFDRNATPSKQRGRSPRHTHSGRLSCN